MCAGSRTVGTSSSSQAPRDNEFETDTLIQASPDGLNAYDPRYGANDLFQPGAQGQFSVKFIF